MPNQHVFLALCATLVPLAAQDPTTEPPRLDARSFLPPQHTLAGSVDMAALKDGDLWDAIERSPAKMLLGQFERMFGFDLAEVDRVDFAMQYHPDAEDFRKRQSAVIILRGSERLTLDKVDREQLGPRYEFVEAGNQRVLAGTEPALVSPRPGLVVFAESHHLLRVCKGELRGGVPAPDLMPLTVAPKALAHFATLVTEDSRRSVTLPKDWFDAEDPIRHLAARLVRNANDELVVHASVGFATGKASIPVFQERLDELLAAVGEQKQLRTLLPVLAKLTRRAEGKTLVLELPLGSERAAVGAVTQLVVGFLIPRRAPGMAPVPAPESAPATAPAKKGAGKGK